VNSAAPSWFATCPKGVESLLAAELAALGAGSTRESVAGVSFSGAPVVAFRACLWSRLANRVLWPLATVDASDADSLYRALREMPWADWFAPGRSIAVDFSGTNRAIRNTQFGAQRVKDAIVDWFRAHGGVRPAVDRRAAEVRINLRLVRQRASVSLDLAGHSLHQRGYRRRTGAAPLKENLAAAILLRADWPGMAARGGALIDPMCGSGTLLIEGAMMAADIAPGLARGRFAFEHLSLCDAAQWQALLVDARGRAERGLAASLPEIRGYDSDAKVIHRAMENIERAGLKKVVRVSRKPLAELSRPTHRPIDTGLLVTNPPYGERMGEREQLHGLYRELGEKMSGEFPGWRAAVFTSDIELGRATGLRSHKRYALFNGAIASHLLLFDLRNNTLREPAPQPATDGDAAVGADEALSEGAAMFANRLRKNRRRLSSWLKKAGIECYRLYDADMPEYAVAVDIYADQAHVAEYRAPASVSADAAARRLQEVRAALPAALDIDERHIAWKVRSRQRGAQQYTRQDQRGETLVVREGAARLRVNLHDYLDTGLFLDHRPLRLRIAREARGADFLNLFAYTGSATVHAALGGARSTTSVDVSNTYTNWLADNLALNDLSQEAHRVVRADCLAWLQRARDSYDLVLLDPPSFSNSKSRQDDFDVQRDHPALVRAAMARLRPGGVLYFSNNRRGFRLDPQLAQEFHCQDISAQTIDRDFERNRKVHQCWCIRHAAPQAGEKAPEI